MNTLYRESMGIASRGDIFLLLRLVFSQNETTENFN
mgnify:CR=1 FL=1